MPTYDAHQLLMILRFPAHGKALIREGRSCGLIQRPRCFTIEVHSAKVTGSYIVPLGMEMI